MPVAPAFAVTVFRRAAGTDRAQLWLRTGAPRASGAVGAAGAGGAARDCR